MKSQACHKTVKKTKMRTKERTTLELSQFLHGFAPVAAVFQSLWNAALFFPRVSTLPRLRLPREIMLLAP